MRVSLLLGAASVMALGACATNPDGSTGTTLSQTQQGALIGAAAGGLYGATRDSDKNNQGKDFLKGAVLGAAAGAVVGNIIEAQEKQLRQVMTSPGVQIINHGDYLQVIMPSGLLFASDSAAISGQAQNDLYGLAQSLNQYPNSRVEIYGHTDSTASDAHNMDLSQRRAQSVGGILTAAGVSSSRLVMVGRGESQPVASNDSEGGRAQNRRVEILIRPTN
ncbi:MAG TPA: OmpA family protein [Paracoccus sp. (in: a-proteobacteria)]|uniref:OmpA family protein n=1 Tax=uncultured Paracoccus sp. TaxID=189685 RepID=UPI00262E810B|nr:OmpA family protein [uncultured Paracoccus sp.]HMQ41180.1 OmpA family protein [Paracoccus sp. (in: a-proteobacteria)]